ncbi:hypothetical protein C9374_000556 [Naegleria lovaniensis]|uniref:Mitochondrial import inner membrane translocase subunit n=1 Tax=Naegleria lovaniensis TaxID=51637 RepID=A0AA88KT35_NAELO|nr:uncharacterized protein C9374_000556 [Naegleria lovaniensis]KAG2388392.1 hypothetical protein C9374_000556 [Naegleria lovaniensis]
MSFQQQQPFNQMQQMQQMQNYQRQQQMQMMQDLQIKEAMELFNEMVRHCVDKCIEDPKGDKLDENEKACVVKCGVKYIKHNMRVTERFQAGMQNQK